jgi:S-adenosylmethionine:tRNA ribosyltransferase-isomerase
VKTNDFSYILPEGYVAQTPVEPRDHSRLLVLNKSTGDIKHSYFYHLANYLEKDDLLILNNSRVISARFFAHATDDHVVEFLLLRREKNGLWESIGRPGKKIMTGQKFKIKPPNIDVEIVEKKPDGLIILKLSSELGMDTWGQLPIPPYIHNKVEDPERYQTVYAKTLGSSAAPTAGLHFTHQLLESLEKKGVRIAYITLHIGLDTFRPIKVDDLGDHKIHREYFEIPPSTLVELKIARQLHRRIIAVGTTSVRTLEQTAAWGNIQSRGPNKIYGWAEVFIMPGYTLNLTDGLITNFHLPRSTPLILTSTFVGWGKLMAAYQAAIANQYRFYSFGDAMLII